MSDPSTPTPPAWWKKPRTIAWTVIVAVFVLAAVVMTAALRGALAPADDTTGYIDTQEIEELIEAEAPQNLDINPELLEAGYTLPTVGPFCDEDGNVVDTWQRADVQWNLGSFDLPTPALIWDDTQGAPLWVTSSLPDFWTVSIIEHPVIDINTLTDGQVLDLTDYTTAGTFAIFTDGCNALPPQDYALAYQGQEPPFLHRLTDDGSVNIAAAEQQDVWGSAAGPTAMYSTVYTEIIDNIHLTQQAALYPLLNVTDAGVTYQLFDFDMPVEIFTGVGEEPLVITMQVAEPDNITSMTSSYGITEFMVAPTDVTGADLLDGGFCFPSSDLGVELTIIENPTAEQMPPFAAADAEDYTYLVRSNLTGPIADPTACPWLLGDITRN